MKDVKLEYENLWASDSVNNMIKFGSGADYKVNISRTSGGTLTFNTFIKELLQLKVDKHLLLWL